MKKLNVSQIKLGAIISYVALAVNLLPGLFYFLYIAIIFVTIFIALYLSLEERKRIVFFRKQKK